MLFFLKGTALLYGGQEITAEHCPSLFDSDRVLWTGGKDLSPLIRRLAELRKETLSPDDLFLAEADEPQDVAILIRDDRRDTKIGVFSLKGRSYEITAALPDGNYTNLIDGSSVTVSGGKLRGEGEPVWFSIPSDLITLEV